MVYWLYHKILRFTKNTQIRISLRPIIDSHSPLYKFSKHHGALLKLSIFTSPHSLNSSYRFLEDVRTFVLLPSHVMASLDVISLFTSIPFEFTCNVTDEILPQFEPTINLDKGTTIKLDQFLFVFQRLHI